MNKLIIQMQKHGVLIDTNLLVLLAVGLVDPAQISKHKKLSAYTVESFEILFGIFNSCRKVLISSHIIAETSNLMTHGMYGDLETKVFFALKGIIDMDVFQELHIEAEKITKNESYFKYGISDSGLLDLIKEKVVLLTDDYRLSGYAESKGLDVLNFNHLVYALESLNQE
ncbi:hypothetical protein [Acinetobacter higginsii]|uniref:hypothetical protein n=1 Tax=Acinetobacter higginsii TaxID=70347 RepID=UPI002675BCB2|nr:hypothetical protein [Acinetobacter higginsii]MDO3663413.1 hypothetical protein [Acinetobacter higginsii]